MGIAGLLKRDQDFRWFWSSQTVSVFGTQVTAVALPLTAALTLHAGAGGVSAIATASFLPNVALPLFAGRWLERRRRRRIMIWADAVRAAALVTVPLSYVAGVLSIALLAAVAVIVGAASVVFDVGSFAYIPTLVGEDDLPTANQAMQGSTTIAQVGGPGLAGLLVQLAGPARAVGADALSYVVSVIGLAAGRRVEPEPEVFEGRAGVLSGLREIVSNLYLRALTAHAAFYNFASQILTVNLVVWVVRDRGASPGLYGAALSAEGVGAFIGTMIALRLAARAGYGRAFAASLALSTGLPILIAVLPFSGAGLAVSLGALQLFAGIGLGSANVLSVTLRQVVAPRGSLARTNGGYRTLIYGVMPVGSLLGGLLGEAYSARVGVAVATLCLLASALPMMPRSIRSLRDPRDAAAVTRADMLPLAYEPDPSASPTPRESDSCQRSPVAEPVGDT